MNRDDDGTVVVGNSEVDVAVAVAAVIASLEVPATVKKVKMVAMEMREVKKITLELGE